MQFKRLLVGRYRCLCILNVSVVTHGRDTERTKNRRFKCIVYKTNKIYHKISTIYTNASKKKSMIIGCNI